MINVWWSWRINEDTNYYLFKAFSFILLQTVYFVYIFDTKPHTSSIYNSFEFINESALILLGYVMLIFSGLTPIDDLLADKPSYMVAELSGVVIAAIIFCFNYYLMGKTMFDALKKSWARRKLKKSSKT